MSRFATKNNQVTVPRRTNRKKRLAPGAIVTSNVPVKRRASRTASTTNLGGGKAFKMSDKMELTTTAYCSLIAKPGIYETDAHRINRLLTLVESSGAEYAAKLALKLRIHEGMRSISHLLAAKVGILGRGQEWLAPFFEQVCVRADDPSEIIACYWKLSGKKGFVPNAMRKGFAKYLAKLDAYRLAKYAGGQRSPSLVDVVNLCHPKPTSKNKAAFKQLMKGQLKNVDTWEAQLSKAGQTGEQSKAEVWAGMINEGKMGQLGLLRNLRNIAQECDQPTVREATRQLTNPEAIRKSGILPFQYLKAYEVMNQVTKYRETLKAAIDDSVEIASANVPSVGDNVLIAIDESGSMGPRHRENASLFAAVLLKANPHADVMFFAERSRYQDFNRKLPILELQQQIRAAMRSGGTSFPAIFAGATRKYDSIIILSDQEGWMGEGAPVQGRANYEQRYSCKPTIFCFDVGGDGSLMFREDSIILLAGFSFGVFKLLNILRQDRVKLVDVIDRIQIGQPLPSLTSSEDEDEE